MAKPEQHSEEQTEQVTEETTDSAESGQDGKRRSFSDLVRNLVLAGVGTVVVTQEQIKDFVGTLVEKGELAENEGKKLVRDFLERRKKKARDKVDDVESQLEGRLDRSLERVLHSISIPTKRDVQELHKKIEGLARKFDELVKSLAQKAANKVRAKATSKQA